MCLEMRKQSATGSTRPNLISQICVQSSYVAVPLLDGQWLPFVTALPQGGPAFSRQFLLSMGIMAFIILAVSAWVVRRVTAPLAALSTAAERFGNDLNAS